MTKIFYLSEIVKFAIEKEKESVALYKGLSDQADTKDVKAFFNQLMQEEQHHKDFYTSLLNTVPQEQSAGVKEDAEYNAYMQELIRTSRSVPHINLEKTDIKTAIDYAVAREKDSILFYVGLKNYLPAYDSERIDIIIKEEAKHMAKLMLYKHPH